MICMLGLEKQPGVARCRGWYCAKANLTALAAYVPTRREVATLAPVDLATILDCWMWESPAELIPSHDQIREVRSVLAARPDAGSNRVQGMIEDCDRYLDGTD